MWKDLQEHEPLVKMLLILLIIAVGSYVVSLVWQLFSAFSDIFIILISAWLLSFILEPVVNALDRVLPLPRIAVTLLLYLVIAGALGLSFILLIPVVTEQIQTLTDIIPRHLANAPKFVSSWGSGFSSFLDNSLTFIPGVAQFFFSLFMVFILSFYLIVDKENIKKEILSLTPKKWHDELLFFQEVIDKTFASFLRVQVVFGILTWAVTWIVLQIMHVDFAAAIAFLSGVFGIVPLVGPVLSLLPPVIVAFIADPAKALVVLVILVVAQQIVFNIVGAKIMGSAFKLHPAIVLLSFIVGAKIAGGLGAILAVPVLSIAVIAIQQLGHRFIDKRKRD